MIRKIILLLKDVSLMIQFILFKLLYSSVKLIVLSPCNLTAVYYRFMLKANENTKMSTTGQNNGKKSSNSSTVNTPSSTPITTIANGTSTTNTQSSPPPNNAPKYGTLVPNRIFVGGISANTTEGELMQLFSNYGTVKAAKIIQDRAGVSRGYGFITFENEDDAKRPLREAENIVLRERKLNIAPAIKKQPFNRTFDASSPPAVAAGNPAQFFFPPGAAMPYFQGGVAYYHQPASAAPGDPTVQPPVYQTPPMYPTQTGPPQAPAYPSMMFPQTIYMPQQYPIPMPFEYNFYQGNGVPPSTQYMAGGQTGPGGTQCNPIIRSSSPQRPNCYAQQLPPYNPNEQFFYNLPMYGTTMEGPAVYSEAFDLGAGGPYTEDNYDITEQTLTSQDVDTSLMPSSQLPLALPLGVSSGTNFSSNQPQVTNNDTSNVSFGCSRPSSLQQQQSTDTNRAHILPNDRKSQTPVVSVLSIEQQQEKDYSSMQSGRRRKPIMQNNQNIPVYPSNGFVNPFVGFNPQHPPPPLFGPHHPHSVFGFPDYRRFNGYIEGRPNNFNINRTRKRNFDHRQWNDHSSRSSLRTDSNSSSASLVDENKNEDNKIVNTPPPAPYSPQLKSISYAKSFHNNNYKKQNNNNNDDNMKYYYYNNKTVSNTTNDLTKNKNKTPPVNNNNNNNLIIDDKTRHPESLTQSSDSQVHLSTTTNQSYVPAVVTAQPQARRSKRSLRRSGAGSGMVNEIGAGDAPLPDEVAGEVRKKMDSLKL
ncbi:putative uncharacterized protein DDB_G0271606 isoform X2 [Diorhabda sublineata]|uniref:putative uncharacterized protein DDB_G0271606 isoform X2 n=1 Tax=Diorhabda sublineata TaxID=1163346 RepID=UPI0024E0FCA4|nr:putative uncharacterized protein DDB_G0271606 isoform X2 [Diorhabda sublineata]